ncbi:MAG: UDP-4-amino-4,6-dideoxy-N-acetyl-beta-L-altrosamine transaminase [Bacteroidia bacterium]
MSIIPYGKQQVTDADIQAVVEVLQSDYWTQGPVIQRFEKAFAEFTGAKYAVAVANGTAALHVAALGLGVKEGDTYLVSAMTFAASSNCILYCGGKVDFVDIDANTFLLDLNILEDKLKKSKKGQYQGIVAVDFGGLMVNLEELKSLADKHELKIIEDASHSPAAYFIDSKGERQLCGNGKFADATTFSFHPVKHIACGEGGMITTNDADVFEKMELYRTHGITRKPELLQENHGGWYYEMQVLGYNYRLSELHAALGISQLQRIEENVAKRNIIAQRYQQQLQDLPIQLPYLPSQDYHALHLYIIRTKQRKALYEFLRKHQIYTQVHYLPVHYLPYYQTLGFKKGDFPQTESYYEECLTLPIYPQLSETEQDFVIAKIRAFFEGNT